MEQFFNLIKPHMTDKGFQILYIIMTKKLPDAWNRPTSSTGKHHIRENGTIPSTLEHTYEMIFAAIKIARAFKIESGTSDMDVLLFAISLHDGLKRGESGQNFHTHTGHDRLMANKIRDARETLLMIFNEDQCELLEECIRMHSGRWSTGLLKEGKAKFTFKNYHPLTECIHLLDMLSTQDLLKSDWNNKVINDGIDNEKM